MSETPRSIVENDADLIENFVTSYLLDVGVGVQIVEVIAKSLYGGLVADGLTVVEGSLPSGLYNSAVSDIATSSLFGGLAYDDLDHVIEGAASLEFLVRYANKVNPLIIPQKVIPSGETVKAALAIFNESKQAVDQPISS